MKNFKLLFAIVTLISFTLVFAACDDTKDLSGEITISPTTATTGTELTANYSGSETIKYQWNKDETAIDGKTSKKFTPTEAGSYTVTVSAYDSSYNSKTSTAVAVTAKVTNQTPVAGDYTIGNLIQTAGSVTAVTITPKSGKSSGARTIKYSGSTTIPQTAGTYAVTFDVAAATGWNAVAGLSAGNLTVNSFIEMVWINAGTFQMGSPTNELDRHSGETQHSVTLTSGFYMGKYQVTQAQYEKVMGSNPSSFKSSPATGETQGNRPVEQVSWYDALIFCNKLSMQEGLSPAYRISGSTDPAAWGTVPTSTNATWDTVEMVAGSNGYRLPTEAQWEYACRAGTTTAYNQGSTWNDNWGWIDTNSNSMTHEVGKKTANAWDLYDMHGNVYEWCWDWYGTYASEAQIDPVGASSGSGRVGRGGMWRSGAQSARSASRDYGSPFNRSYYVGVRLLRP